MSGIQANGSLGTRDSCECSSGGGVEGQNPSYVSKLSFKNIDLPSPWGKDGAHGGAEEVTIANNLPPLEAENWHECMDVFPSEPFSETSAPQETPQSAAGEKRDDDRWNFIMNKLINIENNTSNLTRNVNTLTSKVDGQAGVLKEVKLSTVANERKINELFKNQEAIMEEVDQRVSAKFQLLEASLQQGNTAFEAQVLEKANNQVRMAVQEVKDDVLQEKCQSRKINLLLVGIKETEGEEPKSVATTFFKNRMALPEVKVDTAYRLGKLDGGKPRPLLVRFSGIEYRQQVWFAKSKVKMVKGEPKVWIQEDLPKPAKHIIIKNLNF